MAGMRLFRFDDRSFPNDQGESDEGGSAPAASACLRLWTAGMPVDEQPGTELARPRSTVRRGSAGRGRTKKGVVAGTPRFWRAEFGGTPGNGSRELSRVLC